MWSRHDDSGRPPRSISSYPSSDTIRSLFRRSVLGATTLTRRLNISKNPPASNPSGWLSTALATAAVNRSPFSSYADATTGRRGSGRLPSCAGEPHPSPLMSANRRMTEPREARAHPSGNRPCTRKSDGLIQKEEHQFDVSESPHARASRAELQRSSSSPVVTRAAVPLRSLLLHRAASRLRLRERQKFRHPGC